MDTGTGSASGEFIQPSDHSRPSVCALCHSSYEPDGDLDSRTICSDCKFLLAEDLVDPVRESRGRAHRTRGIGRQRTRYSSSESITGNFSQQFSEMMSRVRHGQSATSADQYSDLETNIRLSQNTSSNSTPSNSRRWVAANSDAESSGFDNRDSFYGESESSISFSRHRGFHGDSETISFSAYGWESDNSVDGQNTMDSEMCFPPGDGSDVDSDTDIDPMHAGVNHWGLDPQAEAEAEGDEDDEEDEWEEDTDDEGESVESVVVGSQLSSPLVSHAPADNNSSDWYQLTIFPEIDGMIRWSVREDRGSNNTGYALPYLDELELPADVVNTSDYLDSGSFEDLLQYLADNDTSRRGAPPASVSFIGNLPVEVIDEDTVKRDPAMACAICKDVFVIGNKVNRLPCCHLYHPSCILPWLRTRNSCPLCRYELPTDDKDYEAEKQDNGQRIRGNRENVRHDLMEDDFAEGGEGEEEPELSRQVLGQEEGLEETSPMQEVRRRGRWLFLAAAPIVSIMGIAIVLFLGNPLGRGGARLSSQEARHNVGFVSSGSNRTDCKTRRWWFPF
ncbi:hypothetical protein MLD38_026585 [Melastoma candidum]|uniref:Uncharacterized protein n=1 Tax=Melastoma candidum TaxID=119954 RepID=A0ACB9P0M0_9MYRT|nr:hypothetical protein MLD38_026585 [Melastoma candidum]